MLVFYKTTYKIATWYTPQMPAKYIVSIACGNERDNTSMRVLNSRIIKLEKLHKAKMQVVETIGI
jgi:hypothetical protein